MAFEVLIGSLKCSLFFYNYELGDGRAAIVL